MGDRPNLLFLCHRIPYPPDKGEKIRAWHMLRRLARDWRIHLGCLVDDPADLAHLPALRDVTVDLCCVPVDRRRQTLRAAFGLRPGRPLTLDFFAAPALRAWISGRLAAGMDRGFVYSSSMAPYLMGPRLKGARLPRVLDMVDVDSEKWTTYAADAHFPMRAVWAREGRTLLAFERAAVADFDHTLFVSDAECRRFAELAPESRGRIGAVENGVELDRFSPDAAGPSPFPDGAPALVFTGTMDYRPNVDAVTWFARSVLPLLRTRGLAPRFVVVGANPSPDVLRLASLDGVTVTGRVADSRPYIGHAAVSVAPLRIARGIQNKVLEAMAMARPVVASPQAHEGVNAVPGRDLLVADGAGAMADAIAAVLDGRHPGLGAAARLAVERAYDWSHTLAPLDALLRDPAAASRPSREAA